MNLHFWVYTLIYTVLTPKQLYSAVSPKLSISGLLIFSVNFKHLFKASFLILKLEAKSYSGGLFSLRFNWKSAENKAYSVSLSETSVH